MRVRRGSVSVICWVIVCVTLALAGSPAGRSGTPAIQLSALASDAGQKAGTQNNPAQECADVYFIGARGSGELASQNSGLGPEVDDMASVAHDALVKDKLTFSAQSVSYPAASVDVLKPTQTETYLLNLAFEIPEAEVAATALYGTNVGRYLASIKTGVTAAVRQAQKVHSQCPGALLIMAGYSQGAMVMHQAELQLASSHDTDVLSHIAGTLLLGDGDRIPGTAAHKFGSSTSDSAEGIRTWFAGNNGEDVPEPGTTADICNTGDIVCDFSIDTLLNAAHGIKVHTSYPGSQALTSAAEWVAGLAEKDTAPDQWTAIRAPMPAGAAATPNPQLTSVRCPSVSWCAAVGYYVNSSGGVDGLLLTGSGSSWTAATAPVPADAASAHNTELESVSCSSASWCVAVGIYVDSAGNTTGLLLTWSGGTWTAARAPFPAADPGGQPDYGFLTAVACVSASMCVAAGNYGESYTATGEHWGTGAELLTWLGKSWTAIKAPMPANGQTASAGIPQSPSGAACTSALCVIVGRYQDSSGTGQGLLLTWSQGSWEAAEAPVPDGVDLNGGDAELSGVACPSPSSCVAAGSYQTYHGGSAENFGLIVTGASSKWAVSASVLGQDFRSVSCPAVSSCAASGSTVLTGSGTSWQTVNVGTLSGDQFPDVSCPSALTCTAVASSPSENSTQGAVLTGAGQAWTPTFVTLPQGISWVDLNSVSCPTPAVCVAAGQWSNGAAVLMTGPA